MSFGFGISDAAMLMRLAWRAYEGAKQACDQHEELTKEMYSHHGVLEHLYSQISHPDSLIHKAQGRRGKELGNHIEGCQRHLERISKVLTRYNKLRNDEKGGGTLWEKLRFGIGGVKDIDESRRQMTTFSRALALTLQLYCMSSHRRIEREISRLHGDLKGLREAVNLVVAKRGPIFRDAEGSVLSDYSNDDRAFWRNFRRDLVETGYSSRVIRSYQGLIQNYVRELCERGILDEKAALSKASLQKHPEGIEPSSKPNSDHQKHVAGTENEAEKNIDEKEAVEDPTSSTSDPSIKDEKEHASQSVRESHNSVSETQPYGTKFAECSGGGEQIQVAEAQGDKYVQIPRGFPNIKFAEGRSQNLDMAATTIANNRIGFQRSFGNIFEGPNIIKKASLTSRHNSQHLVTLTRHLIQTAIPLESQNIFLALENEEDEEGEEVPISVPKSKKSTSTIRFRDARQQTYLIPFTMIKKWEVMNEFILQLFKDNDEIGHRVHQGCYNLHDKDNNIIHPDFWSGLIKPDMDIIIEIGKTQGPSELGAEEPPVAMPDIPISTPESAYIDDDDPSISNASLSPPRKHSRQRTSSLGPSKEVKHRKSKLRSPSPTPSRQSRSKSKRPPTPSILSSLWNQPTTPRKRTPRPRPSIPRYSYYNSPSFYLAYPTQPPPPPPRAPRPAPRSEPRYRMLGTNFTPLPGVSYTTSYFASQQEHTNSTASCVKEPSRELLLDPIAGAAAAAAQRARVESKIERKGQEEGGVFELEGQETQIFELEA